MRRYQGRVSVYMWMLSKNNSIINRQLKWFYLQPVCFMCCPNKDHLHVFTDQYHEGKRTEQSISSAPTFPNLSACWWQMHFSNRHPEKRFFSSLSNQEIHWLESQAEILQIGTAKVFGDGVVTMSLKLFWVSHFQVSYTLCYPIPSFTSGRLFEEKSMKSNLHI